MRITRGPGFDPQLHCLNFFLFSVLMSVPSFDGYKKNDLFDVFVHRQDRLSYFDQFIVKSEWCRPLLAVDCKTKVTQQCSADMGRRRGVDGSVQLLLQRDSSVVRSLVRITKGSGFYSQLRRLIFFRFPS